MKKLTNWLHIYFNNDCPMFLKRFKLMYSGECFAVYKRTSRWLDENITIWRTSDKCIRFLRTFSKVAGDMSSCDYRTFRSITALTSYLSLIVL